MQAAGIGRDLGRRADTARRIIGFFLAVTAPAGEDGESAPAAQAATTTVASATTADTPEPPSESLDSFNVRVSTGPFASRSASPLGPTLASIDAEATQQVDRHERAMSQEIEGLEPVDGEQSTAWRSEDTDEESSSQPGITGSSGFAGPARSGRRRPGERRVSHDGHFAGTGPARPGRRFVGDSPFVCRFGKLGFELRAGGDLVARGPAHECRGQIARRPTPRSRPTM